MIYDNDLVHYCKLCGCGFILDLITGEVHKVVIACPCEIPPKEHS